MIPEREIKEQAREFGVPTSTIERDYVQNWFLSALRPINMAFKGGTGIRKVYIENYRFSDDLDFTLLEPVDADILRTAVIDAMVGSGMKAVSSSKTRLASGKRRTVSRQRRGSGSCTGVRPRQSKLTWT